MTSLAELSLAPEHRRGHGALYDAVNHGRIEVDRLRNLLAAQRLPRAADGRTVLADLPVILLGRLRSDRVLRRKLPAWHRRLRR